MRVFLRQLDYRAYQRLKWPMFCMGAVEGGLQRASQEEGGGGLPLASWKAGSERCAIWDRVRSMLMEVGLAGGQACTAHMLNGACQRICFLVVLIWRCLR